MKELTYSLPVARLNDWTESPVYVRVKVGTDWGLLEGWTTWDNGDVSAMAIGQPFDGPNESGILAEFYRVLAGLEAMAFTGDPDRTAHATVHETRLRDMLADIQKHMAD